MFENLLDRFVAAVGRHDSPGLAALFTEDGIYDDYFFGAHQGRSEIAAMLDRFHVGGKQFVWEFLEPVCDGRLGYARYCFRYSEVFDRAVAFTQLGYAPERVVKLMGRYTRGFRDEAAVQSHLARREALAAAWR